MSRIDLSLENLDDLFPSHFTEEQVAKGKTLFLKELSLQSHKFYGGKVMTVPKAGIYGFNWFNVWYTPGVSKVSTTIRDDNDASFELSNRGNLVGVVTDSTRVLGDGDCTCCGGLGVMEGKAFLMKYLGGVDAVALCMNSLNKKGEHDPDKIIEFVKMLEPSFGAINLEDIAQPNCYKVLDTLREECNIPVWHDDAQGTGCVTLAGLINAMKLAGKDKKSAKLVFLGAGAANATIARLVIQAGYDPEKMYIFDSRGGLHMERYDIEKDKRYYRKWELCLKTNPECIQNIEEALVNADALIAVSTPGPDVVKPEWITKMADKPIVFACANPVPEIYPYAAKKAGAFIVATGRGDFSNQVNNSLGFPAILKGALLVRAHKITDEMSIKAAYSIANYAEKKGIHPEYIIPKMSDTDMFAQVAADVAMEAIENGVARTERSWDEVYHKTLKDITDARNTVNILMEKEIIPKPDIAILENALEYAIKNVS